jgi:hypothetical protein
MGLDWGQGTAAAANSGTNPHLWAGEHSKMLVFGPQSWRGRASTTHLDNAPKNSDLGATKN